MIELEKMVFSDFESLSKEFTDAKPFPHVVIDNFLDYKLAKALDGEFPAVESDIWYDYRNLIERKRTCNNWDLFPEVTYKFFSYLNSNIFMEKLNKLMPETKLFPDVGLNGGGWHAHEAGGMLNTHLDYSIHPKLGLERRLNIILYINENFNPDWGGSLGLWSHCDKDNQPSKLIKSVKPIFNRAVIFDTTCNSWHGLPEAIKCPSEESRRSLAIYYMSEPRPESSKRCKALFAPRESQKKDPLVLDLIKKRSGLNSAKNVYNTSNSTETSE
ncbi:2OG-Fe(II) oxygenase [Francisella adeliensis]|uniref:2OG-Fe(II) oxygenase n=1 Tax=Francisella adeliensis TaxID=2007306 RepID=A0A2Z4XXR4_9GAMM|nr:2OG-Fe(II) oxygenase [Francisella adeliensis]AXA33398.1 proline hydroxylase [Francisella adeliensis]MBK2085414.1 2OG-Fe(II) oxygenase [Francisella adeliensis]MBK2097144.1 2OG-Fe(II) oxygenase [Francisella adeliensis]QIW11626.1 2OG-Fe(II) oxygenase [Francisella adeliensis]QIW13501.1 2OG-Fe(II) oxygenase [Francisella adeliensis]